MSVVDVSDLDLAQLLIALWENSSPASFFRYSTLPSPYKPSRENTLEFLEKTKYIDYFEGRCIKIDFSDPTQVNPWLYNRDMGAGAFERIANKLRASK